MSSRRPRTTDDLWKDGPERWLSRKGATQALRKLVHDTLFTAFEALAGKGTNYTQRFSGILRLALSTPGKALKSGNELPKDQAGLVNLMKVALNAVEAHESSLSGERAEELKAVRAELPPPPSPAAIEAALQEWIAHFRDSQRHEVDYHAKQAAVRDELQRIRKHQNTLKDIPSMLAGLDMAVIMAGPEDLEACFLFHALAAPVTYFLAHNYRAIGRRVARYYNTNKEDWEAGRAW
ncbi:hypothetical protein JCM10207_005855 [Rhodosporidiobolus poonsookiae]